MFLKAKTRSRFSNGTAKTKKRARNNTVPQLLKKVVTMPFCHGALVLLCLFTFSCSRNQNTTGTSDSRAGEQDGEKIEGGFSYTSTEGGKVVYEVDGERATGLAGEVVKIQKPRLVWHLDDEVVNIRAEEGEFEKTTEKMSFTTGVEVEADSGSMKCDHLEWDASSKRMRASGDVSGRFSLK